MRFAKSTPRLLYFTSLLLVLIFHSTLINALDPLPLPRSIFTVNTTNDTIDTNASDGICVDGNNECSLRAAIMSANYTDAADEIILPVGTYNLTRSGLDSNALNGDLDIFHDLTITGADRDTTIIVQTYDDGAFQIFSSTELAVTVNISGLTVKHENQSSITLIWNGSDGILSLTNMVLNNAGNGVTNEGSITITGLTITDMYLSGVDSRQWSNLTIKDSTILNNRLHGIVISYASALIDNVVVDGNGFEGIYIYNAGQSGNNSVTINRTTVSDNEGSGIYISTGASVALLDSTISNNQAGTPLYLGGGIYTRGHLQITGSLISGNSADEQGGGIYIENYDETSDFNSTSITNSTLSGNISGTNGGAIYLYTVTPTKLKLNGVTITGNSAISGGGIYAQSGVVESANTILYGNSVMVSGGDCYDTGNHVVSQGHNLLGDNNSCPNFTGSGDQVGVNPLLSGLANNGGLTQTHALQAGSPAINAGNPATCIGYDQRYYPRNGICDIGAYEADAPAETVTPTLPTTSTATATNTPISTSTTDPNVTPTATYTSTPEGVTELLINGDFEAKNGDSSSLLPWALSNGSKDKIKCNTPTKAVAYEGDCAFLFKGSAGESSKLSQLADSTGNFNTGDILVFNLYINAKGAVNMKAKVKIIYSDSTPTDKINLTMASTSGYSPLQDYTFLFGNNLSKIKVQINNRSASGKIYLDAVSLLHSSSPFKLTGGLLPLP